MPYIVHTYYNAKHYHEALPFTTLAAAKDMAIQAANQFRWRRIEGEYELEECTLMFYDADDFMIGRVEIQAVTEWLSME